MVLRLKVDGLRRTARMCCWAVLLIASTVALSACHASGSAALVVKIGLLAPFEGIGRPLGYAVLSAAKSAVDEANASGELGSFRLALVALNDEMDPEVAAAQARVLAQDDEVMAVLGPFSDRAGSAAALVFGRSGIPALVAAPLAQAPVGVWSLCPPPEQLIAQLTDFAAGWNPPGSPDRRGVVEVFFPGDAAAAADRLRELRSQGWDGVLIGGPDVLRPWFITLSGLTAEGAAAAACVSAGAAPRPASEVKGAPPDVELTRQALRAISKALAVDIARHGRPSRHGLAEALASQPPEAGLAWYHVAEAQWRPVAPAD